MNTDYALKQGNLIHISNVEQGLKCDCTCPGCGEKMIARKGLKMVHHFAHQNSECSHGIQTILHLMAKTILEQERKILLPEVKVDLECKEFPVVSESKMIEFEEVILEKRFGEIIPDILIKTKEKFLIIEIFVTHKTDDIKRKKIEGSGISALEINLSGLNRIISFDDLRKILIEETDCKYWIYNHLSAYYKQKWLSVCEVKPIIERGFAIHVDSCPANKRVWQGKSYANVIDDCGYCEYLVERIYKDEEAVNDELLYCSGKVGIIYFSGLKKYLNNRQMQ